MRCRGGWDMKNRPRARPNRVGVEAIGRSTGQDDRIDSDGVSGSKDCADVAWFFDAIENNQQRRGGKLQVV